MRRRRQAIAASSLKTCKEVGVLTFLAVVLAIARNVRSNPWVAIGKSSRHHWMNSAHSRFQRRIFRIDLFNTARYEPVVMQLGKECIRRPENQTSKHRQRSASLKLAANLWSHPPTCTKNSRQTIWYRQEFFVNWLSRPRPHPIPRAPLPSSARPSPPASTCPGTSSSPIRGQRCTSALP